MSILLSTFWFIWEIKYVLFWLYLWQLKEYHLGRFVDHFRTHKGKKLLFDFVQAFKLFLLILFLVAESLFVYLFSLLFLLYLCESLLFLRAVSARSVKKPIKTPKTSLLTIISFAVVVLFIVRIAGLRDPLQPVFFLGFDILTPIIISAIVIFFQPFFVLVRNGTLRNARNKIERIKSTSGLKVIAITGSYGKTSTKEFLSAILSKKFKVLSTEKHQNSEIGVAMRILRNLESETNGVPQIFIAEVGAYNKGKVKEVCSILKPDMGIVTGVNEQHLALFGSLKNLLSAEGGEELAASLPKNGIMFLNGDNKYCLSLYKKFDGNKKIYSLTNKTIDSDIWSEEVEVASDYISFIAIDKNKEAEHFRVNILGKHNVQNLLGAILIAKELGMSFSQISDACKGIVQEAAGMTIKRGKHNVNIIDSSYSANPDGVFADLDYFSIFAGKKVIVMPCLIELGGKSSEIHEKIGRKIGEVCDLAIITSKDKFKEIEKGFNEAKKGRDVLRHSKKNTAKCVLCDNPHDIYSMVTLFCKSGDAVLLEGRVPAGLISLLIK